MKEKHSIYKGEIVKHLYFGGVLSCSELSVLTGKSLPLATRMLNDLLEEGVVQETGLATSTGGRRPQTYALTPNRLYVVSVAMDQYVTRLAIMDIHNHFVQGIKEVQLPLPNNPDSLKHLGILLEEYISQSQIDRSCVVGIGIGMPGFVDVERGINHSFLTPPSGDTITGFLKRLLRVPVFIDNDSSLIALSESKFGAAKGRDNCMVVNIGWGVGLGMILNGVLFRGNNGFAGEFSHIPIFTNNKICSCGKLGCLETETSLIVMVEKARQGVKEGKSTSLKNIEEMSLKEAARNILAEAVRGDRYVIELLGEIGYNIGRGIAILIHILNPSHVILSGRGAAAGRIWLAPVQKAINENCIPRIAERTTVTVSSIGIEAELIGAGALVLEHIDPAHIYNVLKLQPSLDEVAV